VYCDPISHGLAARNALISSHFTQYVSLAAFLTASHTVVGNNALRASEAAEYWIDAAGRSKRGPNGRAGGDTYEVVPAPRRSPNREIRALDSSSSLSRGSDGEKKPFGRYAERPFARLPAYRFCRCQEITRKSRNSSASCLSAPGRPELPPVNNPQRRSAQGHDQCANAPSQAMTQEPALKQRKAVPRRLKMQLGHRRLTYFMRALDVTIIWRNRWIAAARVARSGPALRRTYVMLALQLFRAAA